MTNLQPGPEMDAAVARALGWEYVSPAAYPWRSPELGLGFLEPFKFSTDIYYAVRDVLPEIERRGWRWMAMRAPDGYPFQIHMPTGNQVLGYSFSPTLGESICHAFLEAVEKMTT